MSLVGVLYADRLALDATELWQVWLLAIKGVGRCLPRRMGGRTVIGWWVRV